MCYGYLSIKGFTSLGVLSPTKILKTEHDAELQFSGYYFIENHKIFLLFAIFKGTHDKFGTTQMSAHNQLNECRSFASLTPYHRIPLRACVKKGENVRDAHRYSAAAIHTCVVSDVHETYVQNTYTIHEWRRAPPALWAVSAGDYDLQAESSRQWCCWHPAHTALNSMTNIIVRGSVFSYVLHHLYCFYAKRVREKYALSTLVVNVVLAIGLGWKILTSLKKSVVELRGVRVNMTVRLIFK